MMQTLLATLALVVISSFTMTMNVRTMNMRRQALAREFEEMGASIAVEAMEIIRSRAYDDAVLLGQDTSTPNNFTFNNNTNNFPTGNECSVFDTGADVCDDIDDFHKMATAVRPFVLGADTIFFEVNVDVQYVDGSFAPNDARSYNKEVTVLVQDVWPETGGKPFIYEPIRLSRVLSFQF